MLVAHGGRFGGYSLFIKDKKLYYVHNYVGVEEYRISSVSDVPAGEFTARYEFVVVETGKPDLRTGKGAPGTGTLYINDIEVAHLYIPFTVPQAYSLSGEGFCVGRDVETPVSTLYAAPFDFNGAIDKVIVEVGPPIAAATNQIGDVLMKD